MSRVIHFEVQADDVQRAKVFYEKSFGWKVNQVMNKENGGMDYWMLITGEDGTPGINGGLYQRPADNAIHTYDCTIEVDNIDDAIAAVKANGGLIHKRAEFKGEEKMEMPGIGRFARGTDPEGNIFGLLQSTATKPM